MRNSQQETECKECNCAPAACIDDKTQHNNGVITKIEDQHQVLIGGRPVARVGDIATYPNHGNSPIYQECLVNVLVNGKRVARLNDRLLCGCPNDDYIATANPMVLIGGVTPEMPPRSATPGVGEFVKFGYTHALDNTGVQGSVDIFTMDGALITSAILDPKGEALVEVPEGTGSVICQPCHITEEYKHFPEYEKKANPLYQKSTEGWILDSGAASMPCMPSHAPTGAGTGQRLESWDDGSLGGKLSSALSSSGEWIWDVLSGDFAKDPSMGQIICRGVLYFIPLLGKALDAQDISACMYFMLWKGRYKEPMMWFMLVVTLIGCIPVAGDAAKLCLKALGKGGGKTVTSMIELFAKYNIVGKGDAWKKIIELKQQLGGFGKIAADKITAILGFIADKLATIKKWAIFNSGIVAKIDEVFEALRWMEAKAGEMAMDITDDLTGKLDDLIAKHRKQEVIAATTKTVPEATTGSMKQAATAVDDRWHQFELVSPLDARARALSKHFSKDLLDTASEVAAKHPEMAARIEQTLARAAGDPAMTAFLEETIQHSQRMEVIGQNLGLSIDPYHDLVGPGSKFDLEVVERLGHPSATAPGRPNRYVKNGVASHSSRQQHHHWINPDESAHDIIDALRQDRGYSPSMAFDKIKNQVLPNFPEQQQAPLQRALEQRQALENAGLVGH